MLRGSPTPAKGFLAGVTQLSLDLYRKAEPSCDNTQPRRQFPERCRRAVLRFKRRIGRSFCVRGRPNQRNPLVRRSPGFAKPIGHPFTVSFATEAFHPLTHRISSKVFSLICLSKTHSLARISKRAGFARFC